MSPSKSIGQSTEQQSTEQQIIEDEIQSDEYICEEIPGLSQLGKGPT